VEKPVGKVYKLQTMMTGKTNSTNILLQSTPKDFSKVIFGSKETQLLSRVCVCVCVCFTKEEKFEFSREM